jgi:hypothetical protein
MGRLVSPRRMVACALLAAVIAVVAVWATGPAAAPARRAVASSGTSFLYVLQAKEGWATRRPNGHWRLSLRGVSLLEFTDRPMRRAASVSPDFFVANFKRIFGATPLRRPPRADLDVHRQRDVLRDSVRRQPPAADDRFALEPGEPGVRSRRRPAPRESRARRFRALGPAGELRRAAHQPLGERDVPDHAAVGSERGASGRSSRLQRRTRGGTAPNEDGELAPHFRTLGGLAAKLHDHARAWQPPASFARRRWDFDTTVGDAAHWGSWRAGVGVGAAQRSLLERASQKLAELAAYGTDPERFGLVHADLRLANVLFDGEKPFVIDFDDCGWSWFMFDLAACATFIEDRPDLHELVGSWLDGYRALAPLGSEEEAIIPSLIMLRRLQVLAWIGSHAETELAREEGVDYTEGTCVLAERYLAGEGPGI